MTDRTMEHSELVSALVDGQLRDAEFAQALAHLAHSSEARQNWHAYHVVGDVMRTGQAAAGAHDADFVLRLRARLQQESPPPALPEAPSTPVAVRPVASANDRFWRLVVGLASVAMVGVVAWQGFQGLTSPGPQLAVAPASQPAVASPAQSGPALSALGAAPVMIRDPQLDALLAAHRQFGGTSALQMPTGFLRNATFEEGAP